MLSVGSTLYILRQSYEMGVWTVHTSIMPIIWYGGMGGRYYAYNMTLLWQRFITQETMGVNFCPCCAYTQFNIVKTYTDVQQQVDTV